MFRLNCVESINIRVCVPKLQNHWQCTHCGKRTLPVKSVQGLGFEDQHLGEMPVRRTLLTIVLLFCF